MLDFRISYGVCLLVLAMACATNISKDEKQAPSPPSKDERSMSYRSVNERRDEHESGRTASDSLRPEVEVEALVEKWFGKQVELAVQKKPTYLIGDFNGDGKADVAIVLRLKASVQELARRFQVLNPWLSANDPQATNKLATKSQFALGIIHGGGDWRHSAPQAKFILLDAVYDEMRLIKHGKRNDDLPAAAKGDGIFTGTEDAGGIIYWDGTTYRWEQFGD